MSRKIHESDYQAVLQVVVRFPEGVSARRLWEDLPHPPPLRSLQYRLMRMLEKGRLERIGQGRASLYRLPVDPESCSAVMEENGGIPLGTGAREIRAKITRPLSWRDPVGHQPGFLAAYIPNRTAWLSPATRGHLARIGQVGMAEVPAGTYLRKIMDRLLIDLSWNSSRLEGNTYSLLETQRLLEAGEIAQGKAAHEAQMILNHKAAIEMLAERADELGFNRYTICNLHALLSDNLVADPAACGRVRNRSVRISGSVYFPLEIPHAIENRLDEILQKAQAIKDPFEQAFYAMVHLPYLLPFEDVNKRVSRLAANIPFIRQNLCPLSFTDVPQDDYVQALLGVYELNQVDYLRDVFVWAYQRSAARYSAVRQSLGEPDPFRLHHREKIRSLLREVVLQEMSRDQAQEFLVCRVQGEVDPGVRSRFLAVIDAELEGLHSGNIARYRLSPVQFARWHDGWK